MPELVGRRDEAGDGTGAGNAAGAWLKGLGSELDRTLYRLQQQGLALSTVLGVRLWNLVLNPTQPRPGRDAVAVLNRRYRTLLDRDLDNVARGYYPRKLLYSFPLFEYLGRVPEALLDMPRVAWRSYRGRHHDLPANIDARDYPAYYRRTFHWQTDGWLSDRSARLYDAGVEFLFGGTADVMRRMTIPPVVDGVGGKRRPRVLDVGCGTGRFLRALGDALPRAKLYGIDLSPHYVRHARRLLAGAPDVSLVAENAQHMPFADGFFDAVTSVFLFHELPSAVRRDVMRQVRRVLRPGGTFVVCDSAQLVDSPELKDVLGAFPKSYHEPYYKGYLKDDLAGVLEDCGFQVTSSAPWLVSKVVVARNVDAK
jgi:ubiquinone/menaquinone biosynthesis C-methylase UbiE